MLYRLVIRDLWRIRTNKFADRFLSPHANVFFDEWWSMVMTEG